MGNIHNQTTTEIQAEKQELPTEEISPIDKLLNYAKQNEILDIDIVTKLRSEHLADNSKSMCKYNTDSILCKWATSAGLLNLIKILIVDLGITEYDEIALGSRSVERIHILDWLINIHKVKVKSDWLCIRSYGINFDPVLQVLLSTADPLVVEKAYVESHDSSEIVTIRVHQITAYCSNWTKIDWKKMFCHFIDSDEAIKIFENKKIVENNLVPLNWVKTYLAGDDSFMASNKVIKYFKS